MLAHWTVFPEYVALGAFGAAALEWIKKYELSNKLEKEKYKAVTKSFKYWGKFVLFVFASGFVAWAMNENNPNTTVWQIVVSGMSASALANKGMEVAFSKETLHAGITHKIEFKDLF